MWNRVRERSGRLERMGKKLLRKVLSVGLLFILIAVVFAGMPMNVSMASTLHVGSGQTYSTIRSAINAAKAHREKDGYTERFELFINGWEFANGFSELNDPIDQYHRLKDQERRRVSGDSEAQMIDYDYIHALMFGFPPTGGLGIGIDRLVMILTNQKSIKEVILFPQVKSKKD